MHNLGNKQYEYQPTGLLTQKANLFGDGGEESPLAYTHKRFPITEQFDLHTYLDPNFTPKDIGPYGDIEYMQAKYDNLPYYNYYSKPDSLLGKTAIVYNNRLGDLTNESVALDALSHGLREQDPVWQKEYLPTLMQAFDDMANVFVDKLHPKYPQEFKEDYVDGFIRNMMADPALKRRMGYWDEELQEAVQNPAIHNALTEAYSYINPTVLPEVEVIGNNHAEGGRIEQLKKWDNLSLRERSEMMRAAIRNGITNLADIKDKYNEFAEGGNIYSGVHTATQKMNQVTNKEGDDFYGYFPIVMNSDGVRVMFSSMYRPGAKTAQGKPSKHSVYGEAGDIVPIDGSTFEDIERVLRDPNSNTSKWMLTHGFGYLNETTPEVMARTGATGKHVHVGKDSHLVKQYADMMKGYSQPVAKDRKVIPAWERRAEAYWAKAEPMYKELLDAGINPVAAAGILGNIAQESGFNPNAANSVSGGHWGYLQNDRNITPWVRANYGGYDHQHQMNYLIAGLQGRLPEKNMGLDRRFNGFNARMRGVTDPEMAAYLWEREYERSANENIPERKYFARYFYDRMNGTPSASSPSVVSPQFQQPQQQYDLSGFAYSNPELLRQMEDGSYSFMDDQQAYNMAQIETGSARQKYAELMQQRQKEEERAIQRQQRQNAFDMLFSLMDNGSRRSSPYNLASLFSLGNMYRNNNEDTPDLSYLDYDYIK